MLSIRLQLPFWQETRFGGRFLPQVCRTHPDLLQNDIRDQASLLNPKKDEYHKNLPEERHLSARATTASIRQAGKKPRHVKRLTKSAAEAEAMTRSYKSSALPYTARHLAIKEI